MGHELFEMFGVRDDKAMLRNGMQKRQIAHELGISASAISKWISRGRLVT
jgi:transposase